MTITTTAPAPSTITLDAYQLKAVQNLQKARELSELAKSLEVDAKAILNDVIPAGSYGVDYQGTVLIERQNAKTSSVDRAVLKALFPEAFSATYKETLYTKLVLPKA
jgi:hypothetical protein